MSERFGKPRKIKQHHGHVHGPGCSHDHAHGEAEAHLHGNEASEEASVEVPIYKSAREIEKMRAAGRLNAECHALVLGLLRPGIRTEDLDQAVARFLAERGAESVFLGYKGYPAYTCISINEEVVHGIPGRRKIEDGDLVSVDIGVRLDGYIGDAARTHLVGDVSEEARKLKAATDKALELAIACVRPGEKLSTIGRTVQTYAEANGYSVVRKFVGHGVGARLHEAPQVPNYVNEGTLKNDLVLKPGLTIAIEPMLNCGVDDVRVKKNGWTVVTKDARLSAHSEHTVLVTETGHEILTLGVGAAAALAGAPAA